MALQGYQDDRLRDAAILQDTSEASACAYQQRDGCGRRDALIAELEDRIPRETPHCAQRYEAEERADQQRHIVIAYKAQRLVDPASRRRNLVGPTAHQHENYRQQDGKQREAEAGQLAFRTIANR